MTTILTLLPENATVQKDTVQKFTTTILGAPLGSTTEYKWEVDGAVQTSSEDSLDFNASTVGKNIIKVTSTTKLENEVDDVQIATTELTVTKKKMTEITVTTTVAPIAVDVGERYTLKCSVTGLPPNATVEYNWSTGEKTQLVTQTARAPGNINRTCTVTVKAPDYDDYVSKSNEVNVTVKKSKIPNISIKLIPSVIEPKVGDSYSVTAQVETISEASITYLWNTGETSKTINVTAEGPGQFLHKCTINVSHPDWLNTDASNEIIVNVEEGPENTPEHYYAEYIHPLPHRNTAYIWAGWWVMDEIERITKEGNDWQDPGVDSKYSTHLSTLSKMLLDFPEVDVQESRNGRIVHRSALELGVIY